MKKSNKYYLSPIIYLLALIPLTRAGPVEGIQQLADGLGQTIVVIIQFISNTILDINSFDEFLFAKLLLFTIILLIVYTVISKNPILGDNKSINWIVTSAISILSIRFIPDEFIRAILLQYSTLGVGLTIFLPLALFLFFIHQSGFGPWGRKLGWIIYASSFVSMWAFVYKDIGGASYLYGMGLVLIGISFFFDRYIHAQFGLSEYRKIRAKIKDDARVKAMDDLVKLEEAYNKGYYLGRESQYNSKKKHYEKIIRKST